MSADRRAGSDRTLDRHAKRIRGLIRDIANNSLKLGRELTKAHERFRTLKVSPAVRWDAWLETEFRISATWAFKLMRAAKAAAATRTVTVAAAPEVLAMLTASPSNIPAAAVKEIKARLDRGEKVSRREAHAIVRRHKAPVEAQLPSPTEARKIAAETRTIQFASDGKMYTGASDEEVREAEDRRSIVFGVTRAVETLANVPKAPQEFLEYAASHQLWTAEEEHVIAEARKWLGGLVEAWQTFRERVHAGENAGELDLNASTTTAVERFTVLDGGAANGEASATPAETEPSGKPIELGRVDDHFEPSRWGK